MMNFNDAGSQASFELIPANTIAKARLVIKSGNDQNDPFVTKGKNGSTSYLNCEFIILEGIYAKRKIFDKIGLAGSDVWVNMGKARIRAILESAKGTQNLRQDWSCWKRCLGEHGQGADSSDFGISQRNKSQGHV